MNLSHSFAASAQRHADKTALFWGEREYSFAELLEQALLVSEHLQQRLGVQPGDRVGLWLKNCPEFIPSLFGILHAGAVVVPINNFFKPDEVNYILRDAGINVLVTDGEVGAHLPALSGRLAPSGLVVIIYTAGTTGRPKGAMLSHANLLHNVESCRIVLQAVEGDRFALLLPMFHSYMLTVGILLPLLVGGSILLVKSLHPPRNVLQEILQRQVTILPAIPQFYRSLVSAPIDVRLPLRLCVSGAAPLPAQILLEFEAKFHIPLIEGYGLSEASPVVAKNPLDGTRKPGSIGLPIPHVEMSIQDESGRELGENEIGELCVRGGNVMLGYWQQPEETAKVMRNGWLLTGDVGYRDAQGYYFITDRKKDMLLVNGINVYPREIEEILYQFPGVKEAAVVGRPDPRKGEQPIAFVAANDGAVLEEMTLQRFIKGRLADYKVPRQVVLLAALPRNATGKILKTTLRELGGADKRLKIPG